MSPTYRFLNIQAVALGNGTDLLLRGNGAPPVVLPSSTSRILQICDRFTSLEVHAARAQALFRLSDAGREQTLEVLRQLASRGLLTEYSWARPPVTGHRFPLKRIGTVAIPTSNRATHLVATVQGWIRHFEDHSRDAAILISDDSGDDSTLLACKTAFSDKAQIRYAGPAEKADFVNALVAMGIPRHIASFGLQSSHPLRTGANRNCILLDSVGEPLFSMDDDAVCHLISGNGSQQHLVLGGHVNPCDHFVFSDRLSALNSASGISFDYLAAHELLLGRACDEIAADPQFCSVDFSEACADALASLEPGSPAKVVMTAGGYVGDCGMSSPDSFLTSKGPTQAALSAAETQYRLAFTSREIIRLAPAFVISHSTDCVGVNMGLDASELLPPFAPSFRNSNGVFNSMAIGLMRNRFIGHLPYGVAHLPGSARNYPMEPLSSSTATRISDIMCFLNLTAPIDRTCETYENAVCQLAEHYLRIGRMQLPQFAAFLSATALRILGERVRSVQAAAGEMSQCPAYWRRDAEEFTNRFIRAAAAPENFFPREFGSSGDSLFRTLEYLRKFGEFLSWWPKMWSAASLMRLDKGTRIGRPLHAA